ncbi:hypothetical protein RF11_05915 [Thelohanellus kitauei]|uniref:Uncharacterized protein n=1 Tax=Thelohanellus kitauei TaxID=669202 RepID=A0A0C2MRE0_THEKT|nr:hypothetical protein RF11_05915 [Thelohanellus kitauei]
MFNHLFAIDAEIPDMARFFQSPIQIAQYFQKPIVNCAKKIFSVFAITRPPLGVLLLSAGTPCPDDDLQELTEPVRAAQTLFDDALHLDQADCFLFYEILAPTYVGEAGDRTPEGSTLHCQVDILAHEGLGANSLTPNELLRMSTPRESRQRSPILNAKTLLSAGAAQKFEAISVLSSELLFFDYIGCVSSSSIHSGTKLDFAFSKTSEPLANMESAHIQGSCRRTICRCGVERLGASCARARGRPALRNGDQARATI